MIVATLMACNGTPEYAPSVEFLAPAEGGVVAAGDVAVSVVVTDFELVPPEVEARRSAPVRLPMSLWLLEGVASAHDEEGIPSGYVELVLDDVVVGEMDDTQFTLTGVAPGSHALTGTLRYADGDPLEAPVAATVSFSAE